MMMMKSFGALTLLTIIMQPSFASQRTTSYTPDNKYRVGDQVFAAKLLTAYDVEGRPALSWKRRGSYNNLNADIQAGVEGRVEHVSESKSITVKWEVEGIIPQVYKKNDAITSLYKIPCEGAAWMCLYKSGAKVTCMGKANGIRAKKGAKGVVHSFRKLPLEEDATGKNFELIVTWISPEEENACYEFPVTVRRNEHNILQYIATIGKLVRADSEKLCAKVEKEGLTPKEVDEIEKLREEMTKQLDSMKRKATSTDLDIVAEINSNRVKNNLKSMSLHDRHELHKHLRRENPRVRKRRKKKEKRPSQGCFCFSDPCKCIRKAESNGSEPQNSRKSFIVSERQREIRRKRLKEMKRRRSSVSTRSRRTSRSSTNSITGPDTSGRRRLSIAERLDRAQRRGY